MHQLYFFTPGLKRLCMAASWLLAGWFCAPAQAVVTFSYPLFGSTRAIQLQVGSAAGIDTVVFNVGNATTGNSLAYAAPVSGNLSSISPVSGGVAFRMVMQVPWLTVGQQSMTTTVTSPASLNCTGGNCATYSIPFSTISWTVSPTPSGVNATSDLQGGIFPNGGGTQTVQSMGVSSGVLTGTTADVSATMNFSYSNTTAYPAGTYTGTVTYTASMP